MRVLLVNKFFRHAAGAETVFFDTMRLLEEAGHSVVPFAMEDHRNEATEWARYFSRHRDYDQDSAVLRARDGLASIYSLDARRKLRSLIAVARPDVAHLHNVYHQLTLSIVDELKSARIPSVMTVHDYKPVCPNYQLLTEDGLCTRCVTGSYVNAVVHRCVKGSRAASALAALEATLNRRRRQYEKIDRFITPSAFVRDVLVKGGIAAERIHTVPNPVRPADAGRASPTSRSFVYAGRLAPEKGLNVLLDAAQRLRGRDVSIHVYGDGPMAGELRIRATREGLPVYLHGFTSRSDLTEALRDARALVLPSTWFENCPMSILEAAALGVPAIASAVGGVPEMIDDRKTGILVPPGDPDALALALELLADDDGLASTLGTGALERVKARHRPDAYYDAVLAAYRAAGAWTDAARSKAVSA